MILKSWLLVTKSFIYQNFLGSRFATVLITVVGFIVIKHLLQLFGFFKEFCLNCVLMWPFNSQSVRYV